MPMKSVLHPLYTHFIGITLFGHLDEKVRNFDRVVAEARDYWHGII